MSMRTLLSYLALAGWLAAPAVSQPGPAAVLFVEQPKPDDLVFRVLLVARTPPTTEERFDLSFTAANGETRTGSAPVPAAGWTADGLQLLALEAVTIDAAPPGEVTLSGGLSGSALHPLGRLARAPDGRLQFERLSPFTDDATGRIFAIASCEEVGPRRFVLRVAYINCGARLDRDYDAFLHFEPDATGDNLAVTAAMGLYPSGRPTDASAWQADDVAVVTFGPYELPADRTGPLYVRVGLYDREGDGSRLVLAGASQDGRVPVGRVVRQGDRVLFERTALGEVSP